MSGTTTDSDMSILKENRRTRQTARTGLCSALTSAVAFADLLGADGLVDQLLVIKHTVVNTETHDDDDLIGAVPHPFIASTADSLRRIRAGGDGWSN